MTKSNVRRNVEWRVGGGNQPRILIVAPGSLIRVTGESVLEGRDSRYELVRAIRDDINAVGRPRAADRHSLLGCHSLEESSFLDGPHLMRAAGVADESAKLADRGAGEALIARGLRWPPSNQPSAMTLARL
jgi:hypothetical protein